MFDLSLSSNGDIIFINGDNNRPLKVSYMITKTNAVKVSFDTYGNQKENNWKTGGLKVGFEIKSKSQKFKAKTCEDNAALQQMIKNRLKTAVGELSKIPTFGSTLELYKHALSRKDVNITKIKEAVLSAISDLDANLTVDVSIEIDSKKTYKQHINITIYQKDDIVYNYQM